MVKCGHRLKPYSQKEDKMDAVSSPLDFYNLYKWYLLGAIILMSLLAWLFVRLLKSTKQHNSKEKLSHKLNASEMIDLMSQKANVTFLVKSLTKEEFPYFRVDKTYEMVEIYFFVGGRDIYKYIMRFQDLAQIVSESPSFGIFPVLRSIAIRTDNIALVKVLSTLECASIINKPVDCIV